MKTKLSREQGSLLLSLVRQTIGQRLGACPAKSIAGSNDPVFQQSRATFVTLKTGGKLRGCIGNLEPSGSLIESVKRNGLSAAFDDHRFPPLKGEELGEVEVEVSILSPAERLDYRDGAELVDKLRAGIDGVILQLGNARATFLPQVWEQLPEPADFLNHLCQKAGLEPSLWRNGHPDIFLYQVQSFKEERG